ncbi:MAG: ABC-F family ATP-binding cassette domain-containing protein [Bacteroidota bacterium]|nr:ABC-F family ATP-binding cassette domain-containing protein [Bacteroidota bacterium]MDP4248706.1 ABC-F family ATP-binding cassette domain-containing protein [Bacteroidota bacterium]
MHYVSAEGLGKSFGINPLFNNISFHIESGDKIALIAKNGTGKSTLLKILAGKETADSGKVWISKDITVTFFEQEPRFQEDLSVLDNVFHHKHPVITAIKAFEAASESGDTDALMESIDQMDHLSAWDFDAKVKQIFSRLNIDHLIQPVKTLSGGQRKRVALARTLIDIGFGNPEVLLIMDEPTNHLDMEMVEWLENYLNQQNITLLVVSHDRYFLDNVCNEIWEMDRSSLYEYKGDYENYLEKKAARIESDVASIDKARNLYRKELEWMRKQPKARTTKSKSRQDSFYEVEAKAKQNLDEQQLKLEMKMSRLGGKVAELKKVNKSFGDKIILKGFDYTFKRGDRIGVVGKNGTGKTTFLNMLQGLEPADSGKINIGDTVVFGNYSQLGLVIKEDKRVIEFVKDIAESFPLAGGGSLSAAQFLNLFLFPPDKQYTYVSSLSGGEKRRLHLLSILFRNPNFLILDEPTNDLDLPTLSVLENFLLDFQGCMVMVSHDRYFMDRMVEHLFVFEGEGVVRDFPGNYGLYQIWLKTKDAAPIAEMRAPVLNTAKEPVRAEKPKLTYKEKREFESLEKEMDILNREKDSLTEKMRQENLDYEEIQKLSDRFNHISEDLQLKEFRWLELSEMQD